MTKGRMFDVLRQGTSCAFLALAPVVVMTSDVAQADIVHRYSFNGDATDSVGGADAMLFGDASVMDGQLVLNGMPDTYANLPIGRTIESLQSITVEAWLIWNNAQDWTRIFDFGINDITNMFLTPRNGSNQRVRFAITITGGGGEEQTTTITRLPLGVQTHVAVTLDGDLGMTALYINGRPQVIEYGATLKPSDLGNTPNNYLGKSQYPDPLFVGSIKEFRIYNTALSMDAVYKSFLAGPDAP